MKNLLLSSTFLLLPAALFCMKSNSQYSLIKTNRGISLQNGKLPEPQILIYGVNDKEAICMLANTYHKAVTTLLDDYFLQGHKITQGIGNNTLAQLDPHSIIRLIIRKVKDNIITINKKQNIIRTFVSSVDLEHLLLENKTMLKLSDTFDKKITEFSDYQKTVQWFTQGFKSEVVHKQLTLFKEILLANTKVISQTECEKLMKNAIKYNSKEDKIEKFDAIFKQEFSKNEA